MLYHIFEYLEKHYHVGGAGLFQYISFRAGAAIITSLLISLLFGNRIIRSLKRLQVGETVRELGLDGQKEKEGTPTMGGFIILLATWVPCLLFARLDNIYIILMLVTTLWMTAIGFADDYIKVFKKDKNGLAGKFKIFGQVVLGVVVAIVMLYHSDVVIRMPIEDAIAGGYEVMDEFTTEVTTIGQAKEMVNMAYVKSTLTNIPFFKGNNFEYSSLLGFLGDNGKHLIWIVFLPKYVTKTLAIGC